jgi:uncharacterized protein (DUF1697 family)
MYCLYLENPGEGFTLRSLRKGSLAPELPDRLLTTEVHTMPRFIAFLRAINVGGHTVKMDRLRQLFEALGFSSVETFIASGNVAFQTATRNAQALEQKIESRLRAELGYEVATFVRTDAEVAAIANYQPFRQSDLDAATALNIAFLAEPLDAMAKKKLMALKTEIDDFHVHGREIYWLCRKKQSESTFSNAALEKTLGVRSTLRGANTIRQIAAKYASSRS